MKRILIISPYFPPSNAADMQRIRMSLPYFKEFGWEAEVVCVHERYSEMVKDELLNETIPPRQTIHKIEAISSKWSKKLGFGSLGFRSIWHYRQYVDALLRKNHFDLIYFSTTQFPVCILGPYWKKRFGIPYVIDMQDPWYSSYYENLPARLRPPKYRLVYTLHKVMESVAVRQAAGLISVSDTYLQDLVRRYPVIKSIPQAVITFGAFKKDLDIVRTYQVKPFEIGNPLFDDQVNCVYVGRGGADMSPAVALLFEALKMGLDSHPEVFGKLRFYFIGTSYGAGGLCSIAPVAERYGVGEYVKEIPDRIPFFQSLATLMSADALIIPGSDSPGYTASKVYPYILTEQPILAIIHGQSGLKDILTACSPQSKLILFTGSQSRNLQSIQNVLSDWVQKNKVKNPYNSAAFGQYSAREMTRKQTDLFREVMVKP